MSRKTAAKCLAAAIFLIAFALAAATRHAPYRSADVQEIGVRWIAIERRLAETRLARAPCENAPADCGIDALVRDIDEFRKAARAFIDSDAYRTYQAVSPPPDFGATAYDGLPEIAALDDLALALRRAALDGDRDKAALVSSQISAIVIYAMAWSRAANIFIVRTYSNLLLALVAVVAIFGLVARLFYGMMLRSLKRAKEGTAFSRAVLVAQEKERSLLYCELHDTVAQDLRGLSLGIDKIAEADGKAEREKLRAETGAIQSRIHRRVRDICGNLAPPDLDIMKLPDALMRLCYAFSERTGIECRTNIAEDVGFDFMDRGRQIQFFRVVQEALANVEKHSRAALAIVILRRDADGSVSVSVCDDGEGFDPAGVEPGEARFGIRGMRERAAMLGGVLTINSGKGQDTLVNLRVPASAATNKNEDEGERDGSSAD